MIYIKDMEMPVDCLACRISCKHESYLVTGRPKDCPLEEAKDGDLISRADAIDAVCDDCEWEHKCHEDCTHIDTLKALPSAEAVSRKAKCCPIAETCMSIDCPVSSEYIGRPSAEAVYGEWGHMIAHGTDGSHWYEYECSHCGEVVLRPYNFCPNCGTMMYKDGDDTTGESL